MSLHSSKDTAILSLKEALASYATAWHRYLLDIIIITEQKKNSCTGKLVMVEPYIK